MVNIIVKDLHTVKMEVYSIKMDVIALTISKEFGANVILHLVAQEN